MLRMIILALTVFSCAGMAKVYFVEEPDSTEQAVLSKMTELGLPESVQVYNTFLANFEGAEKVIATHNLLTRLTLVESPDEEMRSWLESYLSSRDAIQITMPDHPRKKVEIFNVARQAKATGALWDISAHQSQITHAWKNGDWYWPLLLDNKHEQAIVNWISSLSDEELQAVALHFQIQGSETVLNNTRLVSLLAGNSRSPELYARLWYLPADEFTYAALAALPDKLAETLAVEQLASLTTHERLSSQSLLLLAKHYSHSPYAQKSLLEAFGHEKNSWYAASAARYVKDVQFKKTFSKVLEKESSAAAKFAMKNLAKGGEQ